MQTNEGVLHSQKKRKKEKKGVLGEVSPAFSTDRSVCACMVRAATPHHDRDS